MNFTYFYGEHPNISNRAIPVVHLCSSSLTTGSNGTLTTAHQPKELLEICLIGISTSGKILTLARKLAVQTHLTPSYRLFSTQDATLVCCFGTPPLVAVKSATVNGRSFSPFSVRPFWDTVGGGVSTQQGE